MKANIWLIATFILILLSPSLKLKGQDKEQIMAKLLMKFYPMTGLPKLINTFL